MGEKLPGNIVKKGDGRFVRILEKEVNPDEILTEIQKVKRKLEDNQNQAEFIANQKVELEKELTELTTIYKQLI